MIFSSLSYVIFLTIVVLAYFSLPDRRRWILLLAASYFFYMCCKVDYVFLIASSTVVSYLCALRMESRKTKKDKFSWLIAAVVFNLAILFFFKYFAFFFNNVQALLDMLGVHWHGPIMEILIPVGISFYTFQIIGYLVDVYNSQTPAVRHLGMFALYTSFFPQLLAGPIGRSKALLPQFFQKKEFSYDEFVHGLKLILWGMFKKVVIADRLALYVDSAYNYPSSHSGRTLIVATVLFSFQMYCDFSGYTDIALGSARLMGFHLMENFRRPYFSRSIAEMWRRWHISLSTWIHDYVYLPLLFRKRRLGRWAVIYALVVSFLLVGLWHGPNWRFVVFGLLQSAFLIYETLRRKSTGNTRKAAFWSVATTLKGILITFALWNFSMVLFRASDLRSAVYIIRKMFSFSGPFSFIDYYTFTYSMALVSFLVLAEARQEYFPNRFSLMNNGSRVVRYSSYCALVLMILLIGVFDGGQFIYFQF